MKNYVIIGAGAMGRVIARDLLDTEVDSNLLLLDNDENQLRNSAEYLNSDRVETQKCNVLDKSTALKSLRGKDIVISAMPHSMSLHAIEAAISAGTSLVDLVGSFPDKRAALNDKAKSAGVLILPGCGVAPGISNICVGQAVELLDVAVNAIIYVGGIPVKKEPPLYYQTVYLLESVFNAYLKPVNIKKDGKLIKTEPLTGIEQIEFPEPIGTLDAFYTDGLASLPLTLADKISGNLLEKTMRYPGHVDKILFLKECGFLSKDPLNVKGKEVAPFELLVKLFESNLKLSPEGDILAMRIIVDGIQNGKNTKHQFELVDFYDSETQSTSMARTTGFPAAIAARKIANGELTEKGVWFPEQIFIGNRFAGFLSELKTRGVTVTHKTEIF
jgi:lysine 6-dehydrogenase